MGKSFLIGFQSEHEVKKRKGEVISEFPLNLRLKGEVRVEFFDEGEHNISQL